MGGVYTQAIRHPKEGFIATNRRLYNNDRMLYSIGRRLIDLNYRQVKLHLKGVCLEPSQVVVKEPGVCVMILEYNIHKAPSIPGRYTTPHMLLCLVGQPSGLCGTRWLTKALESV